MLQQYTGPQEAPNKSSTTQQKQESFWKIHQTAPKQCETNPAACCSSTPGRPTPPEHHETSFSILFQLNFSSHEGVSDIAKCICTSKYHVRFIITRKCTQYLTDGEGKTWLKFFGPTLKAHYSTAFGLRPKIFFVLKTSKDPLWIHKRVYENILILHGLN